MIILVLMSFLKNITNKIKKWENVKLSIGGELELSNNFVEKGFKAMPALGAKWTF
jgi:hypothetical protein